jgi:hypothetical protein
MNPPETLDWDFDVIVADSVASLAQLRWNLTGNPELEP